jgi:hypothetical protein
VSSLRYYSKHAFKDVTKSILKVSFGRNTLGQYQFRMLLVYLEETYLLCAEGRYACISRLVLIKDTTALYARLWIYVAYKKANIYSIKCGSIGIPYRLAKSGQKLLLKCSAVYARRYENNNARYRLEKRCICLILVFNAALSTGPRIILYKGI